MSVSGRAGAGGGGPHQGALAQTVEAMQLYRLGLEETRAAESLDGRFPLLPESGSSLFPEPSEGPTVHEWVCRRWLLKI